MIKQFLTALLLLPLSIIAASYDSTPWQLRVYTNIADMVARASPQSVNKAINILGYYTPGDGGGGMFTVTNTVANTNCGTRFQSVLDPDQCFERILPIESLISVTGFGAHGNDTDDDTIPLQSAINFVTATDPQRKYSTLVFPPGVYKTTAPLLVTNVIRIQGAGGVGPTVYDPLQIAGSMIRYYGTYGSAIEIGSGNFTFRVELMDIRFGAADQSPKPDGVRIENLSEGKFERVNACCGFANGFVVRGCTLTKFDQINSAGNEVGMLIQDGVVSGDFPFVVGFIGNPFHLCNFYLNSIAHIKIEGSIKNWAVRSTWFENSPIAIWVPPPTNFANALQLVEFDDTSFHCADAVNAKVLKIDGGSTTNSLVVQSLLFRNSMFYMGSSNAVSITMTNNLGSVNDFSDITFQNIEGYNLTNSVGSSNSLVYADTLAVGLSFRFAGSISVREGFGEGLSGSIYTGPGAPNYDLTSSLLYRDFASEIGGGKLWRLPSSDPIVEYTEGLFGYSHSHFRPFWFVGTNASDVRFAASVDSNEILLDTVNPLTILPLTVDTNEFSYLNGVTSSIQTQLDSKAVANPTVGVIPVLTAANTFGDSPLSVFSGSILMAAPTTNKYFFLGTGTYFDASGRFELNVNGGAPEVHFSPWDTGFPFYLGTDVTIGDSTVLFALFNNHTSMFQMVGDGSAAFYGDVYSTPGYKQLGLLSNPWTNTFTAKITYNANVFETYGTGSPEGVVTASIGSEYHRIDGGAGTSVYIKESGSGNTGWVGISPGVGGSGYDTVQEEGSSITTRTTLNFVGGGVTASDVSSKSQIAITRTGVRREIWIPAIEMNPNNGGTAGTMTDYIYGNPAFWAQKVVALTESGDEYATFNFSFPSAWDGGDVKVKYYWTAIAGTATQGVVFEWSSFSSSDGESTLNPNANNVVATVTDTYQGADLLHISSAMTVTLPSGGGTDEMQAIRVGRNPAAGGDTKTGDVFLLGVKIQYTESSTEPSAW